jgi:integrase
VKRKSTPQANAYAMIRRRAAADIETKIGNHTFRATGITACLKNGGTRHLNAWCIAQLCRGLGLEARGDYDPPLHMI